MAKEDARALSLVCNNIIEDDNAHMIQTIAPLRAQ